MSLENHSSAYQQTVRLVQSRPEHMSILLVFYTKNDPHSPVMTARYENLAKDMGTICQYIDCAGLSREELDQIQVYTAPTLLWVDSSDNPWRTRLRIAGIVNEAKLSHEVVKFLEAREQSEDAVGT